MFYLIALVVGLILFVVLKTIAFFLRIVITLAVVIAIIFATQTMAKEVAGNTNLPQSATMLVE